MWTDNRGLAVKNAARQNLRRPMAKSEMTVHMAKPSAQPTVGSKPTSPNTPTTCENGQLAAKRGQAGRFFISRRAPGLVRGKSNETRVSAVS